MDWIQQWQSKLNKQNGVAPLVRTGGSRHTGLAALPYRNIHCKARTTVLSIINYLIQLYKTASDAGSPNAFGTAIGVGGLITGVAADIMGGMNSGLSQNAIIADVIVDVALWGVAEYGDDVGQAVGAMVGSGGDPAGTAIGKIVGSAVGGVVGNGVSIAMNVDLDGDGETGKEL